MLPLNISRFPTLLGWPGGLGIALLGTAIVMSLTLSLPLRKENTTLNNEIRQVKAAPAQASSTLSAAEIRQRLEEFVDTLPKHDAINDTLNQLHDLAASHHLSLKNSEYRPTATKGSAIRQLRITVKTESTYADLRSFLREIPQALPSLTIEQITITRQKISDTRLDTVVEFSLFYSPTAMNRT
jgi:Tfp pilus assembly protein PilO